MPAAQTNDLFSIELAPAREPLPPSFWESHGGKIVTGFSVWVLFVLVLALVLSRRGGVRGRTGPLRPKRELEALRSRPPDAAAVSEIARIVRRALRARLGIADEATTPELSRALRTRVDIPPSNAELAIQFLQRCDAIRFAPAAPPGSSPPQGPGAGPDLIAEAMEVVERFEIHPAATVPGGGATP